MSMMILIPSIILTLISLPIVFQFVLFASWSTIHMYLQWVFLLLAVLAYVWLWANTIYYMRHKKWMRMKLQLLSLSGILLCLTIILVTMSYDAWQNRYEVLSDEVDLTKYQPFESDKLATLKQPSTLTISEPLPVMDGATALYPVYASYAQALYPKKTYQQYDSEVLCTTTPTAYENLLNHVADIIFVAGPSEKQKAMFDEAKEEMVLTPIGKEGFVFFVHKDNPINELSIQQIQDIYEGNITNWKQVGGADEEILAFQRPEGSGSQSALLRLMDGRTLKPAIEEEVPSGMGEIISKSADYRNRANALGFSFRFYANEMVGNNKIKLLKINGIEPNEETIRNGSYPITNSFYAITLKSNTNPKVKQMLEWLTSQQAKELVKKTGYVSE